MPARIKLLLNDHTEEQQAQQATTLKLPFLLPQVAELIQIFSLSVFEAMFKFLVLALLSSVSAFNVPNTMVRRR
jgi:hypothetical protein